MADRKVSLLGLRPVHPGRGEPSRIELAVVLDYIKGTPVASIVLTTRQTTRLIEQAAAALLATDGTPR